MSSSFLTVSGIMGRPYLFLAGDHFGKLNNGSALSTHLSSVELKSQLAQSIERTRRWTAYHQYIDGVIHNDGKTSNDHWQLASKIISKSSKIVFGDHRRIVLDIARAYARRESLEEAEETFRKLRDNIRNGANWSEPEGMFRVGNVIDAVLSGYLAQRSVQKLYLATQLRPLSSAVELKNEMLAQAPTDDPVQEQEEQPKKIEKERIVVIFVPGIMGSNLQNQQGDVVWQPDDLMPNLWGSNRSMSGYMGKGPAFRKKMLVGPGGHDDEFLKPVNVNGEGDETSLSHRLGTIIKSTYGKICSDIQRHVLKSDNKVIDFSVYPYGYNWTNSNKVSGQKMSDFIDKAIAAEKPLAAQKDVKVLSKVLIVTHSMGGLVTRSACTQSGLEAKTLGVVHGEMPMHGAPLSYSHVRCGQHTKDSSYIDATGSALGSTGPSVAAVFAYSPGPLELLPNKLYKNGDGEPGWLTIPGISADGLKAEGQLVLPSKGDPYSEIYLEKEAWWALMPPHELRELGALFNKPGNSFSNAFRQGIQAASAFHDACGAYVHPQTLGHAGIGHTTADRIEYKLEKASTWFSSEIKEADKWTEDEYYERKNSWMADSRTSSYQRSGEEEILVWPGSKGLVNSEGETSSLDTPIWEYTYKSYSGDGDETVPITCATAYPTLANTPISKIKVDHQDSYKSDKICADTKVSLEKIIEHHGILS